MVAHDAKAKDVNEIDRGQEFEDFEEDLFVSVSNGQPLEGGSGDDVIDSGLVSYKHSGYPRHSKNLRVKKLQKLTVIQNNKTMSEIVKKVKNKSPVPLLTGLSQEVFL